MNKIKIIIKILVVIFIESIFNHPSNFDKVVIFDIGPGDSALVQYKGINILIDGGPADNVLYKLEEYSFSTKPFFDYIIVTHLHDDHYSGIEEIINKYDYGVLIFPNICGYKERIAIINGLDFNKVTFVDSSMLIEIKGNLLIDFIYPFYDQTKGCFAYNSNENNNSIVAFSKINGKSLEKAKVDVKKSGNLNNFLFMGDVEMEVEKEIIQRELFSRGEVNILKAGHHCSKTSNTENFLKKINPDLVICSTGEDNKFGHPSEEVLKRFEEMKLNYVITYEEGDLVFED